MRKIVAVAGDVVRVEWRDAYGDAGWMKAVDVLESFVAFGGNRCSTVAHFVGCDREWLAVAHTVTPDGSVNGAFVIPRAWVDEFTVLVPS